GSKRAGGAPICLPVRRTGKFCEEALRLLRAIQNERTAPMSAEERAPTRRVETAYQTGERLTATTLRLRGRMGKVASLRGRMGKVASLRGRMGKVASLRGRMGKVASLRGRMGKVASLRDRRHFLSAGDLLGGRSARRAR